MRTGVAHCYSLGEATAAADCGVLGEQAPMPGRDYHFGPACTDIARLSAGASCSDRLSGPSTLP